MTLWGIIGFGPMAGVCRARLPPTRRRGARRVQRVRRGLRRAAEGCRYGGASRRAPPRTPFAAPPRIGGAAPMPIVDYVPFDLRRFTTDPRSEERRAAIVEAMAHALSAFLSIRCSVYVQHGRWATNLMADPPRPQGCCVSCGEAIDRFHGASVFCRRCAPLPSLVVEGKHTLVETMFLSSHPNLRPNKSIVERIATLSRRQAFVYDAIRLAHELFLLATTAEESPSGADLAIPEDGVRSARGAYVKSIPYPRDSSAEPRRRPSVGGIGLRIRDELLLHTTSWLHAVDDAACTYFARVLPDGESGDETVANIIDHFAELIADRVARVEVTDPGDPDVAVEGPGLTARYCEHIVRMYTTPGQFDAVQSAERDKQGTNMLVLILDSSLGEALNAMQGPLWRRSIVAMLRRRPPELHAFFELVDVAALVAALESEFATYRDRAEAVDAALRDRAAALEHARRAYRDVVDAIARLESPTAAQRMIHVLARVPRVDADARAALVPPMPWRRGGRVWHFRSPHFGAEPLAHRRVGLDRTCMRVVMLTCLMQQMLGEAEPPAFEPGVMRPSIVRDVARAERDRAWGAFVALREQIRPLTAGVEYAHAERTILEAASNHVEGDVYKAVASLSDWSIQDVATVFHAKSSLMPVVRGHLTRRVRDLLVVKPDERYGAFDIAAIKLFIPLFCAFRTRLGVGPAQHTHSVGDVLRTAPAFREWCARFDPRAPRGSSHRAQCLLSKAEVREGHPALAEFLGRLSKAADPAVRALVRYKRVGTVERWVLDVAALLPLLGASLAEGAPLPEAERVR